MNIRKLEIFYATAIHLNMTKVAKSLYISQPSISQAIKEIEGEVGVQLFDRIGKKLYLTSEGELYLSYVRRILNLYGEVNDKLREIDHDQKGKIRIGASTTIGIYLLPSIIKRFIEEHEGIEIVISIDNTAKIEELLLQNKIDIGFVEGQVESEEVIKENIWKDEIIFICSEKNSLSKEDIVEAKRLQNEKLIMREKGSGTRDIIEKYMLRETIEYDIYMELGDNEAIKRYVREDLGIGCISIVCVKSEENNKGLSLFRLEEGIIQRDLFLIYHKDKIISKKFRDFITFAYRQ